MFYVYVCIKHCQYFSYFLWDLILRCINIYLVRNNVLIMIFWLKLWKTNTENPRLPRLELPLSVLAPALFALAHHLFQFLIQYSDLTYQWKWVSLTMPLSKLQKQRLRHRYICIQDGKQKKRMWAMLSSYLTEPWELGHISLVPKISTEEKHTDPNAW